MWTDEWNEVTNLDFETRFVEISAKPKDEDLISELISLQEEALAENDADVYLKTSHLLFDTYVNIGDNDAAISLFFGILRDNRFEAFKTLLEIIDKLVALLLKTEDFIQLESLLKLRERYLSGTGNQQLMQKFYVSVCQEGLKQYAEAIKTLENITDNISNNNLVSKYLKLSMLYIKVDDFKAAQGALDRAKVFDKPLKNEMFYLVEADLCYHKGEYEEALRLFQVFFVRSKIKNRYLDRYILINIKLEKLGEAWRFYKQYLPKIIRSTSKNYRMQYYLAGLQLALKVNDIDEIIALKEKIAALSIKEEDILDSFDGIKALLAFNGSKVRFKSARDVILETYRVLNGLAELDRLLYIAPAIDGLTVYSFKKGLLLEKSYTKNQWQNTILDEIITSDLNYYLFTPEDLAKQTDYLQKAAFEPGTIAYVSAYKIAYLQNTDGFMIAFIAKDRQFDYISRLLFTTKSILENKLAVQKLLDHHESRHRLSERLLSMKEFGLYKLEDGILFMQNDAAKKQMRTEHDFMPFDDFQKQFVDRHLYLDDFLGKDHLEIEIRQDHDVMKLSVDLWQVDLSIFFLAEDVTKSTHELLNLSSLANRTLTYELNTLYALKVAVQNIREASTLFGFWIEDLRFSEYLREERHQLIVRLSEIIRTSARTHLVSLALDEEEGLLLLISSIDKRVHQRIASECAFAFKQHILAMETSHPETSLKIGAISNQKNQTFEVMLAQLDQTRHDETSEENLVYYDRNLIADLSRTEVLLSQWKTLSEAKQVSLSYDQIGNLLTKKIEMYQVSIDYNGMMGTPADFDRMIRHHHLENDRFFVIFHRMIKDLSELNATKKSLIRYALPVPEGVVFDRVKTEELVKALKKAKIASDGIVLILDDIKNHPVMIENLRNLKEKGLKIAVSAKIDQCSSLVINHASIVDYLWIKQSQYDDASKVWFEVLIHKIKPFIVIVDVDTPDIADKLFASRLYIVKGSVLSHQLSFEELKTQLL
jgi:hypothetical protein